MYDSNLFKQIAEQIIAAGKFLYAAGWSPATSSNYSVRFNDELIAITVSGKHKGQLTMDDIILVDLQGKPLGTTKKSSAETLLHTSLYASDKTIGAVLHTHSVNATVISRLTAAKEIIFNDYEMQKAFCGITTHTGSICIPIFNNTQNIPELADEVTQYLLHNGFLQHSDSPKDFQTCKKSILDEAQGAERASSGVYLNLKSGAPAKSQILWGEQEQRSELLQHSDSPKDTQTSKKSILDEAQGAERASSGVYLNLKSGVPAKSQILWGEQEQRSELLQHSDSPKDFFCPGYLIKGHGLYTWSPTLTDTLRHVEALEFLLQCELTVRSLRP